MLCGTMGCDFDPNATESLRGRRLSLLAGAGGPPYTSALRWSPLHVAPRTPMADPTVMEKLVSLCKRRGFVFQSSEIYGGLGSVWDYGPLGVELKKNVKDRWWRAMVHARDDIEGLDAAILMHPRVWEASGHVAGFTDPLVDCRQCKNRFRGDDPRIKGTPGEPDAQCPVCGTRGSLTAAPPLQPDVQDLHGAGRGAGGGGLPPPGDRPGHLRQLSECAERLPAEDPLRDRADRQGVPERNYPRELHLPDPGIRTDGDAVLRSPRIRLGVVRALAGMADAVAPGPGVGAGPPSVAPARPRRSWPTTPRPPSTSSTSSPSAGKRSKASTTAAIST